MLSQVDIDAINRILGILGFVALQQQEIDFLNEIFPCLTYNPPCFYFEMVGKVINIRGDVCNDSQLKMLQEMSDCNDCGINFDDVFNDESVQKIWGGSVSGC